MFVKKFSANQEIHCFETSSLSLTTNASFKDKICNCAPNFLKHIYISYGVAKKNNHKFTFVYYFRKKKLLVQRLKINIICPSTDLKNEATRAMLLVTYINKFERVFSSL